MQEMMGGNANASASGIMRWPRLLCTDSLVQLALCLLCLLCVLHDVEAMSMQDLAVSCAKDREEFCHMWWEDHKISVCLGEQLLKGGLSEKCASDLRLHKSCVKHVFELLHEKCPEQAVLDHPQIWLHHKGALRDCGLTLGDIPPECGEIKGMMVNVWPDYYYIDDLEPTDSYVAGMGELGLHGDMGFSGHKVNYRGQAFEHAISMHPPSPRSTPSVAHATYNLTGMDITHMCGYVTLADSNKLSGRSYFRVMDHSTNETLFESFAIQSSKKRDDHSNQKGQTLDIDLTGHESIRLEAYVDVLNIGAHMVWLNMILEKANIPSHRCPVKDGKGVVLDWHK